MKKCATCRYWEITFPENHEVYSDHATGTCFWTGLNALPICLEPKDGLLRPIMLAGAGKDCEAWTEK